MTKKTIINLILILIGIIFLLTGIILIVMYQNRNGYSQNIVNILKVIHEKIILDYLLLIAGTILLAIPIFSKFFSSTYELSGIKTKTGKVSTNTENQKIIEIEEKIKILQKEKNKLLNSEDLHIEDNQEV